MNDPMRILKADHREVETLLKDLAESDEGNDRNQMVQELSMKLRAHMEMEENFVYPLVAEHIGAEDEEEAEIEHRLVREALDNLERMVDEPGFGAVVSMLQGGIGHHVQEEERELLPELKDAIERDEWSELGDSLVQAREAAGLPAPAPAKRRAAKRPAKASSSSSKKR